MQRNSLLIDHCCSNDKPWAAPIDAVLTEKVTHDIEHMFDADAVYKALETVEHRTVTMYPSDPRRRTPNGENNIRVKICIKGSTFMGAGLGLFVEEDVPAGYCEEYAGKYVPVERVRVLS
jgi:hypothetical protein